MSEVKAVAPLPSGAMSPAPANGATSVLQATAPKPDGPSPQTKPVPKPSTTAPASGPKKAAPPPKQSTPAPAGVAKPVNRTAPKPLTPGAKPVTTAGSNEAPSKQVLASTAKGPAPKAVNPVPAVKSAGAPIPKPAVKSAGPPGAKSGTPGTAPVAKAPATGSTAPKALPPKVQPGGPKRPVAGTAPKAAPPNSAKPPGPIQAKGIAPVPAQSKGIPVQTPIAKGLAPAKAPAPGVVDKTDKFLANGTKIVAGVSVFLGALDKMLGDDKPTPAKSTATPVAKAIDAKAIDAKAPLPKTAPTPAAKGVSPVPTMKKGPTAPQALPNLASKGPVANNTHIEGPVPIAQHNVLQHDQAPRFIDHNSTFQSYAPVSHPYAQDCGIAVDEHTPVSHPYAQNRGIAVDEHTLFSHPYTQDRGIAVDEHAPVSANTLDVGQDVIILQTTEYLVEHEEAAHPEHEGGDAEVAFVQYTEIDYEVAKGEVLEEGGEEYVYEEESGAIEGEEFDEDDHIDEGLEVDVDDTLEETVYEVDTVEVVETEEYEFGETEAGEIEEETVEVTETQEYEFEETQEAGEGEKETTNFEAKEETWQTAGDEDDAGLEQAIIDLGIVEHDYTPEDNEYVEDAGEGEEVDDTTQVIDDDDEASNGGEEHGGYATPPDDDENDENDDEED